MKTTLAAATFLLFAGAAQASLFSFDLQGNAGAGLLSGNENFSINGTPGSGGEIGAGISYDDVSNLLTINVGWGSGNGFSDLTGNAFAGHIHGPTTSGGAGSFTQSASVKYPLDSLSGWSGSAATGGFAGTVTILEADEVGLLAGKFYINVHTTANGGGEIRGNLVAVPEPAATCAIGGGLLGAFALMRRFRNRTGK